eukprot:g3050.t1
MLGSAVLSGMCLGVRSSSTELWRQNRCITLTGSTCKNHRIHQLMSHIWRRGAGSHSSDAWCELCNCDFDPTLV